MEGRIDHLLFENESMIRDYQAQAYLVPARKTANHSDYRQYKGVKLIDTLDYETEKIFCTEESCMERNLLLKKTVRKSTSLRTLQKQLKNTKKTVRKGVKILCERSLILYALTNTIL